MQLQPYFAMSIYGATYLHSVFTEGEAVSICFYTSTRYQLKRPIDYDTLDGFSVAATTLNITTKYTCLQIYTDHLFIYTIFLFASLFYSVWHSLVSMLIYNIVV